MNEAQKTLKRLRDAMDAVDDNYSDVRCEVDRLTEEREVLIGLLSSALDAGARLDCGHSNNDMAKVDSALAEFGRIRDQMPI